MPLLERGHITLWSGAIVDIPAGWHLCDGTAGTPDLQDRFVVGAGDTYAPAATGGATTHTHDGTTNGHTHTLPAGAAIAGPGIFGDLTSSNTDTFTTQPASSLPPYYALAYIMKL